MKIFQTFAILLVTVALPNVAIGWEADTHYGLVKWLAYHAGFSLDDAELIAASSQSADETHVLMATYLIAEVCARADAPKIETVSRVVKQHHFPAKHHVPDQPGARAVSPGRYGEHSAGNRWIYQELDDQTADLSRKARLERFGSSLHPLADSWSHAGEPDVPDPLIFRCRNPELVWSHPESRGGWKRHDADLTHIHVEDLLETAESAYRFMIEFRNKFDRPSSRRHKDWIALEGDVEDFAKRDSRDAKFDWFKSQDARHASNLREGLPYDHYSNYPCFLKQLSLPKPNRRSKTQCADPTEYVQAIEQPQTNTVTVALTKDPQSPWYFTQQMLHTWLIERDIREVVDEMSDAMSIAAGYRPGLTAAQHSEQVEVLLGMFLVEDHGLVNEMGHGGSESEELREALLNPASASAGQLRQIQYKTLSEVAYHPCSPFPFSLIRSDIRTESEEGEPIKLESYVVTFQLRHVPRELMLLRIERRGGDWKMTSVAWATQ